MLPLPFAGISRGKARAGERDQRQQGPATLVHNLLVLGGPYQSALPPHGRI